MRHQVSGVFAIVVLAFVLRIVFLLSVPAPQIHVGGDDAIRYHLTGIQLREYFLKAGSLLEEFLAGHLFRGEQMLEKYGLEIPWEALKKGPAYPVFVGLFFWLGGVNHFWIFITQALLTSLGCAFFYGIAKDLGQEGAGILSAVLFGIYPPFIFIGVKLLQEPLSIFLFALFYFLVFRSRRTNSSWLYGLSGISLLLLALSKSRLAFFPFFLFVAMGAAIWRSGRKSFPARHLFALALSFLVPYALWVAVVSWQLRKPALFVEHGGMEVLSGVHPDYDGWTPDSYLAKEPDANVARVLQREGVLENSEGGNRTWPSDSKMIGAGFKILSRYPWVSFRMTLDRIRRLWWQPYDWPWREFLLPPGLVRWWHRLIVVVAIGGCVLWWFERPLAVWFLLLPLLYGVLVHGLFHAENRFALPFITFLFPFAGFFLHFLWAQRKILFSPFRKFVLVLGLVLGGGFVFRLSQPSFVLELFGSLSASRAHLLAAGMRSFVLVGFFIGAAFWLKQVLSRRPLSTCLIVTALFTLVPFGFNAFTAGDWREWRTVVRQPAAGIRQEIFLPKGIVGGSVARNLRMDLIPPRKGEAWVIRVNGESLGTLEMFKTNPSAFLLTPPYSVYLDDAKKQAYDARQWFSIPIPSRLLKEGAFNAIEIVFNPEVSTQISSLAGEWVLFGDYPVPTPSPQFQGPLFQRSSTEVSIFKFLYEGDLRLNGTTPLHHQGVRSFYLSKAGEIDTDLSPSPGIQRGEYRIRVEMKDGEGRFLTF